MKKRRATVTVVSFAFLCVRKLLRIFLSVCYANGASQTAENKEGDAALFIYSLYIATTSPSITRPSSSYPYDANVVLDAMFVGSYDT